MPERDHLRAALSGVCLALALAAHAAFAQRGTGPYPAIMETDPGLATHTVYRPAALDAFGDSRRLPIVSWGNGGCANAGDSARNFLTEIASHGILVIAVGPIVGARPKSSSLPAPNAPPRFAPATKAGQLTQAIDWAVAENARGGSRYFGKLDTNAIAIMGYSCGGLQALAQSLDTRIRTLVLLNSGVLPESERRPGMDVTKGILAKLHVPVAYIAGGPSDIAYKNAADDVSRIHNTPVFFANLDVGHAGTYGEPNGGAYAGVASAWLEWQLLGDKKAAKTFVGDDCRLCVDSKWTVEKHGID
jgi:dienelactone hydrolase